MAALDQYLVAMEAAPDETLSAEALLVAALTVAGSGTCGVTTPAAGLALPWPVVTAAGDWLPVGVCALTGLSATGSQAAWRPAWGAPTLPCPTQTGQASFPLRAEILLTPLYYTAASGSQGAAAFPAVTLTGTTGARGMFPWPLPRPYGLSGLDRQASFTGSLPGMAATAWACGLDDPLAHDTDADAVVRLLCQNETALAQAALALADGATVGSVGADALAGRLLAAVAGQLAYVADAGDDVWTCAMGTYCRGTGDCEDGALLLHGLLLAAGVPAARLLTVFGRVGVSRDGHAWLTYRRERDGNWVVLDWTAGTTGTDVASRPPIDDDPYYAFVDYALSATDFFAVRLPAANFFPKACPTTLALPLPATAGTAALGCPARCDLGTGWLEARALAAAVGHTVLARPRVGAGVRSGRLAVDLAPWTADGQTGAQADLPLRPLVGTGLAPGGWGTAGLVLRPKLQGTASVASLGHGQARLSRTRLAARGLSGLWATGLAGCPGAIPTGHAVPGRLAQGRMTLAGFSLTGLGLPSDPGQGEVVWLPCLASAAGCPDDALLTGYHWQTSSLECW